MLFTDPVYLFLFLPVACLLFYAATPRLGSSAGIFILLVLSLLFYSSWGMRYLAILTCSFSINYAAACAMLLLSDTTSSRRGILWLGQIYNFGALIWFKYRLQQFVFTGTAPQDSLLHIAIPIGISFYTFQQAMFLLDVYHRDESTVAYLGDLRSAAGKLRGYLRHAFFVCFFPHLVIGPIVYLSEFQPQISGQRFGRLRRINLEVGVALVIMGLFKKLVLADHLAGIVDGVFGSEARPLAADSLPTATAWLGILAYYLQLYFDFSGYSDLALGSARMLGIRFPINFFSPLKANGIIDHYRRWHITLTRVVARFVYLPLSLQAARWAANRHWSGPAVKLITLWIPLVVNLEIIALWHGARVTFLVFGFAHGIWYATETSIRSSQAFKRWTRTTPELIRGILGRAIFLSLMPLTLALFRSVTVADFAKLTQTLIGKNFRGGNPGIMNISLIFLAGLIAAILPNSMQLLRSFRPGIVTYASKEYRIPGLMLRWRPDWIWGLAMAAMLFASVYFMSRQPPFLYLDF
jgi:alginate O-acetyltransferase complex protein AlgI